MNEMERNWENEIKRMSNEKLLMTLDKCDPDAHYAKYVIKECMKRIFHNIVATQIKRVDE